MSNAKEEQTASNDELIDRIAHDLIGNAKGSIVFGTPIERQKVTVIPVARVRCGFGFGKGKRNPEAGDVGGGGGLAADPAGYIEVRDEIVRYHKIGGSTAVGVLGTIGATIVLSLATIGMAWGRKSRIK